MNGVLNGHRNQPLTELGTQQAFTTAEHINEQSLQFNHIYSSPLDRAYATALIIAETNNLPEPIKLDLLIERDFGVMEGKFVKDIKELCKPDILETDTVTYFLNPEGAETFEDLLDRGSKIVSHMETRHRNESVLLVTHGDIGKMIYAHYFDLPWQEVLSSFHFGNCELLKLSKDAEPHNAHVFSQSQYNH